MYNLAYSEAGRQVRYANHPVHLSVEIH